jgi:signal transduction histidine kinase/ActR/RegA family two-component response regulator
MVWRLVLSLFLHLTLLFLLAIYLVEALNSVQLYTPVIDAEQKVLVSLDTLPALLEAMDTERLSWQKTADPEDLTLYSRIRRTALANLDDLASPVLLPSAEETRRRALIRQWITDVGDVTMKQSTAKPSPGDPLGAQSQKLLEEINHLTGQARQQQEALLSGLRSQQAIKAKDLVNLMWFGVGTVSMITIVFQLFVANSIIGPIQMLAGAVRRMQSGDYTARVRLRSGDEIESLGETFNTMAENIQRNQQELEEKNARLSDQQEALRTANTGLEERVAEKTRELEDKNQKLSEAARLKDEFLATLSHELRTPLTPVITCAHLLGTDSSLDPNQLKNVSVIDRNARALSRMIDELLDLSAVMNNKLRLARERTEINEWARATVETLRPAWEKKQLALTFVPAFDPVEMEIDPTRLAQVVTNLVSNAIKYTEPHGEITVRVTATSQEMRLSVSDTGSGLTPKEIDRIFEMFHQSRTLQTRNVGGLGVGLTVARSLAELHGGGLQAESAGPGRGSIFTLWLPRQATLTTSQTLSVSSASSTSSVKAGDRAILRGRRVLLIEDSADTREAMQRLFLRRECVVTAAGSAEEALDLALPQPPEIIISDIGLPGMTGLELMAKLRARPGYKDVIAVALSGLGREQDIRGAAEAGFDSHLLKPVDIAVLDQTLIEALQKKAQR